jgi:hypothetical protein
MMTSTNSLKVTAILNPILESDIFVAGLEAKVYASSAGELKNP